MGDESLVQVTFEVEGGVVQQSCYEAHTGKAAPTNTTHILDGILLGRRQEESKPHRFKVAWLVGMTNTSVMALDSDGKISGDGAWRRSPDCDKQEHVAELDTALALLRTTEDEKTFGGDLSTRGLGSTKKRNHNAMCLSHWTVERDINVKRPRDGGDDVSGPDKKV